jgi:hypothetical protein
MPQRQAADRQQPQFTSRTTAPKSLRSTAAAHAARAVALKPARPQILAEQFQSGIGREGRISEFQLQMPIDSRVQI